MAGLAMAMLLLPGAAPPETLHAARCMDSAEGHARRATLRGAHLAYLDALGDRVAVAGAVALPGVRGAAGSLIVYRAANLDAAKALLAADPLRRGGVFSGCEWTSFSAVFGAWVGGWRIDPGLPGRTPR